MSAEEEVVISTKNGILIQFSCERICLPSFGFLSTASLSGVEWHGEVDSGFSFNLSLPSAHHHRKDGQPAPYVVDMKYSTIIGGFSLVFSNGLGCFFPLSDASGVVHSQAQPISQVDNALCTAINHKYALISYGQRSSHGVVCNFDEVDRRFVISHRLVLPSNIYPESSQYLGSMNILEWTPDSAALATAWQNGGFALWSVFGSLLTCSLSWNSTSFDSNSNLYSSAFRIDSLAFGKEGFHLWMATKGTKPSENGDKSPPNAANLVCKLSLVKSVLAANPCSSVSIETIVLASEDKLFVGGNKSLACITQTKISDIDSGDLQGMNEKLTNGLVNTCLSELECNAVDSFQWITVSMPPSYLDYNWPVRYFAIDTHTSQNLAIAGLNGLAMYNLVQRRWKLFGNENHERDFTVTGGFIWFYDYLLCGCYNLVDDW